MSSLQVITNISARALNDHLEDKLKSTSGIVDQTTIDRNINKANFERAKNYLVGDRTKRQLKEEKVDKNFQKSMVLGVDVWNDSLTDDHKSSKRRQIKTNHDAQRNFGPIPLYDDLQEFFVPDAGNDPTEKISSRPMEIMTNGPTEILTNGLSEILTNGPIQIVTNDLIADSYIKKHNSKYILVLNNDVTNGIKVVAKNVDYKRSHGTKKYNTFNKRRFTEKKLSPDKHDSLATMFFIDELVGNDIRKDKRKFPQGRKNN